MRITNVRIRNFRGIRSLDIELGKVTVLIGENNSGKTSVLDALKLCLRDLGPRRGRVSNGMDFHLADSRSEPSSADPIEVEVGFSELSDGEWDDELVGRLNRARILQVDDEGLNHVRLRVTCEYDRPRGTLLPTGRFSTSEVFRSSLRGLNSRCCGMKSGTTI